MTKKPSAVAQEAAATPDTSAPSTVDFSVELRGKTFDFTVPASVDDMPLDVFELFEDNKNIQGFMSLIGGKKAAELRAAGCTLRDFNDVIEPAYSEAIGMGNA